VAAQQRQQLSLREETGTGVRTARVPSSPSTAAATAQQIQNPPADGLLGLQQRLVIIIIPRPLIGITIEIEIRLQNELNLERTAVVGICSSGISTPPPHHAAGYDKPMYSSSSSG